MNAWQKNHFFDTCYFSCPGPTHFKEVSILTDGRQSVRIEIFFFVRLEIPQRWHSSRNKTWCYPVDGLMTNNLLKDWNWSLNLLMTPQLSKSWLRVVAVYSIQLLMTFTFFKWPQRGFKHKKSKEMWFNLMHNHNVVEVPIIHSYNLVDLALFLKLLGVYIRSDLRWNYHIDYIFTKASKCLFSLLISTLWPLRMICI